VELEVPSDQLSKMFYYKLHKTEFGTMIAICDKELSGKNLKNKNLDFFVNPRFYGEEEIDEKILELIKDSNDGNVIGNNIVELLLKNKIISRDSIIKIGKIKHAQFTIL
jgi:hypothetical protein